MNKIKYYAGIGALVSSIALSGCGKKEADFSFLEKYDFSNGIGTEKIEEIAAATLDRQERENFYKYVGDNTVLDVEDIVNMKNMLITWENGINCYKVTCTGNDLIAYLYFDQDNLNYLSYFLNHTNCDSVYLTQVQDSKILDAIATSDKITTLSIRYSDIDSLNSIKDMDKLKLLQIENCPNISSIEDIENLTNLEKLTINGTKVNDITHISKLTNLVYLDLICNEISDVSPLTTLENLKNLKLEFNKIDDVKDLKALIDKGIISDNYADIIVDSTTNEHLLLAYDEENRIPVTTDITYFDAQDKYFLATRDENFSLVSYTFAESYTEAFAFTHDLDTSKELLLTNCKDDSIGSWICNEPSYESVSIYNCDFKSLFFLNDFDNLTTLQIYGCPNINYEFNKFGVFETGNMANLKYLSIVDTSIENLDAFSRCENLEYVELKHNEISDYSFLTELPNLSRADITIDTDFIDYDTFRILTYKGVDLRVNGIKLTAPLVEEMMKQNQKGKEYTKK